MAIPELTLRKATKNLKAFCDKRVPPFARDQVTMDFRVESNTIVLFENRLVPPENQWIECAFAKLRWHVKGQLWSILWCDQNGKWHHYDRFPPTSFFDKVLGEIDQDPTCIFFG